MMCRYIDAENPMVCLAGGIPYILHRKQIEEYCNSEDHQRCPFYLELDHLEHDEGIGLDSFTQ